MVGHVIVSCGSRGAETKVTWQIRKEKEKQGYKLTKEEGEGGERGREAGEEEEEGEQGGGAGSLGTEHPVLPLASYAVSGTGLR